MENNSEEKGLVRTEESKARIPWPPIVPSIRVEKGLQTHLLPRVPPPALGNSFPESQLALGG